MILPALQNFLDLFLGTALNRLSLLDFQPNHSFLFFFIQLHLSPRPRSLSPFELPGRVDDTPEDGHSLELGSAKTWVGNQKPGWTSPKHVSNRWIPLRGEKTNH